MDLQDLFIQVARVLSNDPKVIVRFRHPAIAEFEGLAMKIADRHVIDIDPAKSDARMLWNLCHECAHVRLGHPKKLEDLQIKGIPMMEIDLNAEPSSLHLSKKAYSLLQSSPINGPLEEEAQELGGRWWNYADEHMKEFSIHRGEVERRAMALLSWNYDENRQVKAWQERQAQLADRFARNFKKPRGLK